MESVLEEVSRFSHEIVWSRRKSWIGERGSTIFNGGGITGPEERLDCKAEEDERNFRIQ